MQEDEQHERVVHGCEISVELEVLVGNTMGVRVSPSAISLDLQGITRVYPSLISLAETICSSVFDRYLTNCPVVKSRVILTQKQNQRIRSSFLFKG